MHEKSCLRSRGLPCLIALCLSFVLLGTNSPAARPETFSYGGKSYKIVEVTAVEDGKATLRSVDNETVTAPARFLSARLRALAEKVEKAPDPMPVKASADLDEDSATIEAALQEALETGVPPKVWVTGSTLPPDKNLAFRSAKSAIELKIGRDGTPQPTPRTRRNAIFLSGLVIMEGMAPRGENVLVEYFGWDTGKTEKLDGLPARVISTREPEPSPLIAERDWTNLEGNVIRATLWNLKDGEGHFAKDDGTRFKYSPEKLSPGDRDLIKTTVAAKLAEWRRLFR